MCFLNLNGLALLQHLRESRERVYDSDHIGLLPSWLEVDALSELRRLLDHVPNRVVLQILNLAEKQRVVDNVGSDEEVDVRLDNFVEEATFAMGAHCLLVQLYRFEMCPEVVVLESGLKLLLC